MKIILFVLLLAIAPALVSQPVSRQARQAREAFSEGVRKGIDQDFEEALKWFNRAIGLDSLHAEAYYYRGLAYYELQEYSRALDDFRTAIRLDPDKAGQAAYFMELSNAALREVIEVREALEAQETHDREPVQPDLRDLAEGFYDASLQEVEPSGIGVQIAILANPDQVEEISYSISEKFGFPLFIQVVHEDDGILYKISVGNFRQREQAVQLRSVMRDEGFLDSFIISYP